MDLHNREVKEINVLERETSHEDFKVDILTLVTLVALTDLYVKEVPLALI